MYIVESESDSIIQPVLSQGSLVPRPTRRVQAQSLSQSTVRENSARVSGGTRSIRPSWSWTSAFHSGLLYCRNHWSCRIRTVTRPPHRQTTGRESKSNMGTDPYCSCMSTVTRSRASLTDFPPYFGCILPRANSALYTSWVTDSRRGSLWSFIPARSTASCAGNLPYPSTVRRLTGVIPAAWPVSWRSRRAM